MKLKDYLLETIFDNDSDYQIRKVENRHYQITKWTRGKQPKEIYNVWENPKSWTCSCPVRGICKHIKMVQEWIKRGMPNEWDPKDIGKYFNTMIGDK